VDTQKTRRQYERACGQILEAIALLQGTAWDGESRFARHDTVLTDLTENAARGISLPEQEPQTDREILERLALEVGTLCASPLAYSSRGVWSVDSQIDYSRLEELADRFRETAHEIALEIGQQILRLERMPAQEPRRALSVVNG
jgi:hypothetical protein